MTALLGMLGAMQGWILGIAVSSLGGRERRPNFALGLLLFNMSFAVFLISGEHGGLFGTSIYPVLAEYTLVLLFGPALWHYANTVLGRRPGPTIWVHTVPAALWLVYLAAFRFSWITWRWLPPILVLVAYSASYTLAVAIRIWSSRARATALVSHRTVLSAVVVGLFAVHLAQLLRYLFRDVAALADIVPLTCTTMLCIFSVLAFRRSKLFAAREPALAQQKYESSTLTPESVESIRSRLVATMERDRPFLNENLNLADMAARLKVSRSQLSQVVNAELGCSFSELLRQYRVREAQRLLEDPDLLHLTVEAIGYEAGFRSRSAFHSAFKKAKGMTPAQARKNLSPKMFGDTSPGTTT